MNENYGINPNLYGYPANNAYLGQNNFVTIPQPVQRKPILSGGRMVMQESDIRPNEVPNNGNLAVFVQEDLENVYLKTWTGSGTIATNVYRRVDQNGNPSTQGADPFQLIMDRLDAIENFLTTPAPSSTNTNHKTTTIPKEKK